MEQRKYRPKKGQTTSLLNGNPFPYHYRYNITGKDANRSTKTEKYEKTNNRAKSINGEMKCSTPRILLPAKCLANM